ncbi:MAG: hypothetical protein ACOH5I_12790 [Oligoflexus sp.]
MGNCKKMWMAAGLVIGLGLWQGCGSDSDTPAAGDGTNGTVGDVGSVTSLKDIGLSSVLMITLPESVKGEGNAAGLRLDGGKSFEACELRESVREGLDNITQIASTVCMLENDPSITFGEKLSVTFPDMGGDFGDPGEGPGGEGPGGEFPGGEGPGGEGPGGEGPGGEFPGLRLTQGEEMSFPESMQIWIDNEKQSEGKLTIYMCMDNELNQMIEIEGAADGKAKGRMIVKMDLGGSMVIHHTATFDNRLTDANRTAISMKQLMSFSANDKLRRMLAMDLRDEGVSKVLSSYSGSMGEAGETSFASVGLFDLDFGSVLATGSMTIANEEVEFSNASYFDGVSNLVDPSLYPDAFGEEGTVKLEASMVPGYLPASFTPDDFPEGAWDCSGTTEIELSMDDSSAGGEACMEDWAELTENNCFDDATFAKGEVVEIEIDENWDPESIEDLDLGLIPVK